MPAIKILNADFHSYDGDDAAYISTSRPWPDTFRASTVTHYITKTSKGIKLVLNVGNQAAYSYHIHCFSLNTICQFLD